MIIKNKEGIIAPHIHLNGTSKQSLAQDLLDSALAISEAIITLRKTAPNGRDYYTQDKGALKEAIYQHDARIQKLIEVQKEINDIQEMVDDQ